jgi:hypothetical protein
MMASLFRSGKGYAHRDACPAYRNIEGKEPDMSDYEGLDYEARVDAAMDDVLGRDGWCGVCGGWSPANPPMCDLCGVRLCDRCAVEYPDGAFECPDCAREDMERYDRIMALAARPDVPDELADEAGELYETSDGEVAGDDWRPLLERLEAVA